MPTLKVKFDEEQKTSDDGSGSNVDKTPKEINDKGFLMKNSGFIGLNLKAIDEDFLIPDTNWKREKIMGVGAYGKVMECTYMPYNLGFAVKRFE